MVDQLRSFASEVTRVAREVGTEGKLGGQAQVEGVSGTWKDLTDTVNSMAGNLTSQVRNIADVTTAVAKGDLSQKITVDVKGEILELKNTINTMVDQLSSFAAEVTRVAREVGTEGKLGGQADVRGVAGTWKDLTDSVNSMAGNLTVAGPQHRRRHDRRRQRRPLARRSPSTSRARSSSSKNTINTMVDQLRSFASEVTRVAREVGTEGKLGGQADVRGVAGTWKDLTDNVNFMAGNLTSPGPQHRRRHHGRRQAATCRRRSPSTSRARSSSSRTRSTRWSTSSRPSPPRSRASPARSAPRASSAARPQVAGRRRHVEGPHRHRQLHGRQPHGAGAQHRRGHDRRRERRPVEEDHRRRQGRDPRAEEHDQHDGRPAPLLRAEVTRVAREVGTEGKLGGQAEVRGRRRHVEGPHRQRQLHGRQPDRRRSATSPRSPPPSPTATCRKKITVDVKGEILELKNTINTMVDQLSSFAAEVTRVAREVGTEGKLGGQADVRASPAPGRTSPTTSTSWPATSRRRSATSPTSRRPSPTATCRRRSPSTSRARSSSSKNTINTMVDQLNAFASEVTRVAREVGTEGKLGGQAAVHGRRRHLEGPHRQRQLDGRQPDRPGPRHRRGRHRGRQRRPQAQADPRGARARSPRSPTRSTA